MFSCNSLFLNKTYKFILSITTSSIISSSGYTWTCIDGGPSKKNKSKKSDVGPPSISTIIPSHLPCVNDLHIQKESYDLDNDRNMDVGEYPSSICPTSIPVVKEDYGEK